MSRRKMMWRLLMFFFLGATAAAAVAIATGPDVADAATGWIAIIVAFVLVGVALTAMQKRWFIKPPTDVAAAVSVGLVLRLAIAETVFIIAFVLRFLGYTDWPALVIGLIMFIGLALTYAAPTTRNVESWQDQLLEAGIVTDVTTELDRGVSA